MIQLTVTQGGRIVIPAKIRKALDWKDGDKLECKLEGDALMLMTRSQKLQRAKRNLQKYFKPDPDRSIVDEFIAERRAEQAKEDVQYNP